METLDAAEPLKPILLEVQILTAEALASVIVVCALVEASALSLKRPGTRS
jgi:hypothetical protein